MNIEIQTPDERLIKLAFPNIQETNEIELEASDCLVLCGGFEERVLTILNMATRVGHGFLIILIKYAPEFPENQSEKIIDISKKWNLTLIEITYDRRNPAGFGDLLLDSLPRTRNRIFVDVSAMSRLLIVQTLVALSHQKDVFKNVFIAYTEAQFYPPTFEEAKAQLEESESDSSRSILFLSSGVFDIAIVPELSSFARSGGQTRLVTFPSLDSHQLTATRNEIQPSRFSLIEGDPPKAENKWRREIVSEVNQLDAMTGSERFTVCTLDYRQTLKLLLSIYAEHGERERLLISPTGSKMQTVAVAIFRAFIRDVQVIHPVSQSYVSPSQYTVGSGASYILDLSRFNEALHAFETDRSTPD
jgi:hypothetical protein